MLDVHHLHLLELTKQLASSACIVSAAFQFVDDLLLEGDMLFPERNVPLGFGQVLSRSRFIH